MIQYETKTDYLSRFLRAYYRLFPSLTWNLVTRLGAIFGQVCSEI